jgi:hypothetical protein
VSTEASETDPAGERWVDVDRTTQVVRLCIGETAIAAYDAAMSRDQGEGFYATAVGSYAIYQKLPGLTYTPYADAYFRSWAGFDPERFNGFHSWTMDADGVLLPGGGGPTSGCIATPPQIAATIFDFVELGTRVDVHW